MRKLEIQIDDVQAIVSFKKVKRLRVTVRPPDGVITVSAPYRLSERVVTEFLQEKLSWIQHHRDAMRAREYPPEASYENGDMLGLWGENYPLRVIPSRKKAAVELTRGNVVLAIRPTASIDKRAGIDTETGIDKRTEIDKRKRAIHSWYREQVLEAAAPLIEKWEPKMNVKSASYSVRRMKTRWGSCNTRAQTILFNSELATKLPICLEYVVVHELAHLLERSHNARFKAILDRFMPDWREVENILNPKRSSRRTD